MCKSIRIVWLLFGNLAAGLGVAFCTKAGIGVDPVSALYDGVHKIIGLEIGTASFVVNMLILLVCTLLNRKYLKWGTFLSMLSFAVSLNTFVQLTSPFIVEPYTMSCYLLFFIGIFLAGAGFSTVVFQNLGPNCADILLEVLKDRAGISMKNAKITIDLCCTVLGFLMGGTVGLGTVLCICGMGHIYNQVFCIWQWAVSGNGSVPEQGTIDEILMNNRRFVQERRYERYETEKYPRKKLAILTCMDTRLTELLPAAIGLKNGDAKIIRNAGGVTEDAYGSEVKSLLVAIFELGVTKIVVIGHTDCGVEKLDSTQMIEKMRKRKIKLENKEKAGRREIDLNRWLSGIHATEEAVRDTVSLLKEHPLVPKDVDIFGFVMNTKTGELMEVVQ